jgi:hypothetical protein
VIKPLAIGHIVSELSDYNSRDFVKKIKKESKLGYSVAVFFS